MSKEKRSEVKKIVLEIDGKEINLTVDQAKELKKILSDMFGVDRTYHNPFYVESPKRYYDWFYWRPYYVTSSGSSDSTVYLSTTTGK